METSSLLDKVDQLLSCRQWQLYRCHRHGGDKRHYYVTDADNRVLTPSVNRRRIGLTFFQLLMWMDRCGDNDLSNGVLAIWDQIRNDHPEII